VVVSNIVYFHPTWGKIPILTHIFQMSWFNHQLEFIFIPSNFGRSSNDGGQLQFVGMDPWKHVAGYTHMGSRRDPQRAHPGNTLIKSSLLPNAFLGCCRFFSFTDSAWKQKLKNQWHWLTLYRNDFNER